MVGTLDLLLALLHGSPAQEPLAIFLLEPGNLEVLFTLLVRPRSPPLLTDRVFKVYPPHPDLIIPFSEAQTGISGSLAPVNKATSTGLFWSHIPVQ